MVAVWSILDGFYITTRYQNGVPDSIPAKVYTKYAALQAVDLAIEIVDLVRRKIGELEQT
jgi:HEPN domain-containing protein